MIDELKQLKILREKYEALKLADRDLQNDYYATKEFQKYAENHEALDEVKEMIEIVELEIRTQAVDKSRQTGFEERNFGAVSIKEYTKVNITDHKQAVVWAAQNAPSCLTLTKDFDKAAKNLELPFTSIEKEYKAFIAADLSKYLEEKDADHSGKSPEVS